MENFMEQGFIDILKQLVKEQVNAVLTDTKQFKSVLTDYTRNEYKKESRFFIQAVEAGVAKAIKEADDLPSCKKAKIHELVEDYGLSQEVSAAIVDTLALVLRGDTSKSVTATPATPVVERVAASSAPQQQSSSSSVPSSTSTKGKLKLDDGSVYEGDIVNGKPHGKGKLTEKYSVYEGDFIDGQQTGKGKYTSYNGSVYEGDFVDGKWTGKGKLTDTYGQVYIGDFVNNYRHGKGKKTYSNGKVDDGNWDKDIFMG